MFFKQRPYQYDWDDQILTVPETAFSTQDNPQTKMIRFFNLQEKRIDITVNSIPVFTDVAWSENTGYIAAKAKQNTLKLYPSDGKKLLLKKTFDKNMGKYNTFCIISTPNGIDILSLPEQVLANSPGKATIRVILADQIDGWIDVNFESKKSDLRTLFAKVETYTVSESLYIPADSCKLQIVPAGLGLERIVLEFKPEDEKNYSLYITSKKQTGKHILYAKIIADRL